MELQNGHMCHFLGLPRELRDDIYDLCLENRSLWLQSKFQLKASSIATANLLLVSRQFAQEYLEREKKVAALYVAHIWTHNDVYCRLPPPARRISHLHADVVFQPSWGTPQTMKGWIRDTLDHHRRRILKNARQLDRLETLTIRIEMYLEMEWFSPTRMRGVLMEDRWLEMPGLAGLELWYTAEIERGETARSKRETTMALSWSSESRQLEVVCEELDSWNRFDKLSVMAMASGIE